MPGLIYCLDSGTTAVKAAAFTDNGTLLALHERPNGALRRQGDRAEQDLHRTRDEAWQVLGECVRETAGKAPAAALIVTAQGDGVWPLDAAGQPLGAAITWLDGRAVGTLAEMHSDGSLDALTRITGTRPTTASPSVQLAWMRRHDAARLARLGHVLRCKEWLFHQLTGQLLCEPSTAMLSWGDCLRQELSPDVPVWLGLPRLSQWLPELVPLPATARPLATDAARALGLAAGTPVLLGPSDTQATAVGLGVGVRPGLRRASIFGTAAIHVGHFEPGARLPPRPPGTMLQPFLDSRGLLCVFPCFNGSTLLRHVAALTGAAELPGGAQPPAWSGLIVHPFFEPGGERAPITDPNARAALLGLGAGTRAPQALQAAREALAFHARASHDAMGADAEAVVFGGGLAQDAGYARLLADALQRPVLRRSSVHAGLTGVGLIAARWLGLGDWMDLGRGWLGEVTDRTLPQAGPVAEFLKTKYELHAALLEALAPLWPRLSALDGMAAALDDGQGPRASA